MSLKRADTIPAAALSLILLAFAVRVIGLPAQSYWYDEGYTVAFTRRAPGDIVTEAARRELNTPLHYLAMHAWIGLAGDSEFSTRLFSVLCGVAVVALGVPLASLAAPRARTSTGLWAAAFLALWPVGVASSQEARMYALAAALNLAATAVLLARCLPRSRPRDWLAWAALAVAAFATHVLSAFVITAQALVIAAWWFGARRRAGRAPWAALLGVAIITGAWVAWLASYRADYGTTYAAPLGFFDTLARSLAAMALPRSEPQAWTLPAAALMALLVAAALWAGPPRARALAAIGLAGAAGIAAFCALTGKFAGRYPAILAPVFAVLPALALARLRAPAARWLRPAAGLSVCCACAAGALAWRVDPLYANQDFRGAADYLRGVAAADERVVLVSGHYAPAFAHYYGPDGWLAVPPDDVLDVRHTLDYDLAVPLLNRGLSSLGGAWLLEWQQEVIDPTQLAPELLRRQARGRQEEPGIPAFQGLRLRHYRFAAPYEPLPEPLPALDSRVEPLPDRDRGLGADGCIQFAPAHSGDAAMEVACFWRLARVSNLALDTRVSLRLVDGTGAWRAQSDQYLAAPYGLPNSQVDKTLAAFYLIDLPPDLPAGSYALQAVPYLRTAQDPPQTEEISPRVITPAEVLAPR